VQTAVLLCTGDVGNFVLLWNFCCLEVNNGNKRARYQGVTFTALAELGSLCPANNRVTADCLYRHLRAGRLCQRQRRYRQGVGHKLVKMLDSFEILTTSGVVLWSRPYVPVSSNIVNALINDVFIEERVPPGSKTGEDNRAGRNPPFKKEKYTLKWTTAKDLGLIFVVSSLLIRDRPVC